MKTSSTANAAVKYLHNAPCAVFKDPGCRSAELMRGSCVPCVFIPHKKTDRLPSPSISRHKMLQQPWRMDSVFLMGPRAPRGQPYGVRPWGRQTVVYVCRPLWFPASQGIPPKLWVMTPLVPEVYYFDSVNSRLARVQSPALFWPP